MNRVGLKIILAGMCVVLAGCASTNGTVMPKGDGTYHLVTQAATERAAMKMAQADAELTCKKDYRSKRYVMLDHNSEYIGIKVNKGNSTASSIAANVVEFAGRMNNAENYKVEMEFRCG